jgi:membrane dipeptidase
MNRREFLHYIAGYGASLSFVKLFISCAQKQIEPQIDDSILNHITIIDAHAHPDQFYGKLSGSEFEQTKTQLSQVQKLSEEAKVRIVRHADDILTRAESYKSPGAILAIEGADCLEGDPSKLDYFHRQGVRMITIVHYRINEVGDIMTSPPKHLGLTSIGRKVVERMERLGMIVDVAHTHPLTLKNVVETCSKPLIDSHTNLSPVHEPSEHESRAIRRMRSWQQMEWIASTGGLICTWPLAYQLGSWKRKTFKDWATEILEMKRRLGIEHVALGTDGGGMIPWLISGYRDIRDLSKLAAAMLDVGLSNDDIAAFMGGNFYRIFKMSVG